MPLKGKTIIITGASSGIGEACAFSFAKEGANIVLAARNLAKLELITASLNAYSNSVLAVQCDVRKEQDCKNLIEQSIQKFGRMDVLINNAGISMRAMFNDMDLVVMEELMNTNFWGAVYCTKYALPYLLKSKGSVIAVNSWAGFTGLPARTGYTSSKFALLGFMESLRVENLKTGLHVGSIFPGYTASNIRNSALNAKGQQQQDSPLDEKNLMQPEEVANYVVKMVKQRRKYHVITLTGKLMYWINKLFPTYIDKQVYKVISREKDSPFK
ncbi:MAG: short chain dehydrogenase [Bacteroidetes bacterium B1(2017)]|nr:MAG: short chain dehydrogenase [Bacteroidetes bacterium B1(2017)]